MAIIGKEVKRISYKFLYPFIDNKRETFDIAGTYCYWSGEESIDNLQLIVYYKHSEYNNLYKAFEKDSLLSDNRVLRSYKVEDGTVYIYDMIEYSDEVFHFINGSYSMLNERSKKKILTFNNISLSVPTHIQNAIHIYLYPEKYYKALAEELGYEDESILKRTKEIGKKFDIRSETLHINIKGEVRIINEKTIYY